MAGFNSFCCQGPFQWLWLWTHKDSLLSPLRHQHYYQPQGLLSIYFSYFQTHYKGRICYPGSWYHWPWHKQGWKMELCGFEKSCCSISLHSCSWSQVNTSPLISPETTADVSSASATALLDCHCQLTLYFMQTRTQRVQDQSTTCQCFTKTQLSSVLTEVNSNWFEDNCLICLDS